MTTPFAKLLLLLLPFCMACRSIRAKKITRLPTILLESSGLMTEGDTLFWSHNDGGGAAALYQFDKKGQLRKTVPVCNAQNKDWEDMQMDEAGNCYIGDFGNNAQSRKDLTIYKITNFKEKLNQNCLEAEHIDFFYDNQTAFPPTDADKHFDAEAMVIQSDFIYIFAKDFYSKPYSGKTWVYQIPNQVGKHAAKCVAILKTDATKNKKGAITAAAYHAPSGTLVLMSYQKLWILRGGINKALLDKNATEYRFGLSQYAQREAISFADSCTLYITSERIKNKIGGNLSKVKLCKIKENTPILSANHTPSVLNK
jgi:hypothetical protein